MHLFKTVGCVEKGKENIKLFVNADIFFSLKFLPEQVWASDLVGSPARKHFSFLLFWNFLKPDNWCDTEIAHTMGTC